ncbi:krab-a domain-containing protein-like protein, partial [Dinothrombium tinctorium]
MQNIQWQMPQSCDVRNFHGLPSECVRDFIESLELWQVSSGISSENLARRVPRLLKDVAQNWYSIIVQKQPEIATNWETLKAELLKSFSLDDFSYKMNVESQLRNRVQLDNEPFRSYYFDVLKLCSRLNPQMSDDERKSRILIGLRGDIYQQIASSIPSSCDELLQKIQSIESINNIVAQRNKKKPNSMKLIRVKSDNNDLNEKTDYKIKINTKYAAELSIPETIISFKNDETVIPIVNQSESKVILRKMKIIAKAKPINEANFSNLASEKIDEKGEILENDFKIAKDIDEKEKEKLLKILMKFKHCFAKSIKDITPTDIVEVSIDTNGPPIKRKMYRLPNAHKEPLKKILNELLIARIIRPSTSSYCAPILLVQKKSGDYRLVIDYRGLNATIINENCYPLPRIEDVIDHIGGSKVFSLLDCHSGFFTLKIAENDKHKTAFICPLGLFEFNRLPQGLKISPNNFQMMMEKALRPVLYECAKIIAEPLIKLTRKKEKFIFGEEQKKAFDQLKLVLCSAPILAYFNPDLETQLHTDGCSVGIGATLIQIENEKEKVICYYSRVLNSSEKNYSAIEIELLAIIQGIKRFKHYLIGHKFSIVTDSNPLTFLMRTKNLNTRLAHWAMFIQEYNFEIVYRKGSSNNLCDFLSRYPIKSTNFEVDNETILLTEFSVPSFDLKEEFLIDILLTKLSDISKLQREDKFLSHIFDILKDKMKGKNKSLRKSALNYEIKDGKLYRVTLQNGELKSVLAVPRCLVPQVLQSVHDCIFSGGHLGIRKTFERCKTRFHWKSMLNDIIKWVQTCNICQKVKPNKNRSGKLIPIAPGSRPFSQVGVDIIGMLPVSKKGNRFIIVATCYLTKFAVTKAVKNITAKDIAKFLMHRIILQYSVFDTLITDNGVQFRSKIIEELNSLLKSNHKFTTPYHPSTAGQVERCNRQIMQLIRTYIEKDQNDWDIILPYITHLYNVSLHASTKYNPFFLTRGYHPKLPIDMICENDFLNKTNADIDSYVYEISLNLQKARELAKENIIRAQQSYKEYYDE